MLADPERQLSKTHCVITAAGGRYLLTDLSTNGVFMNGAPERVPRNEQVELSDGDEVRLGEYMFAVAVDHAASAPFPATVGHQPLIAGGVRAADPLSGPGDLTPDPLGEDPLDNPFGGSPGAGIRASDRHPPPPARRGSDPFDMAEEAGQAQLPDPEDDLFKGTKPGESWQGPSQPDDVDAPLHAFTAPKPIPTSDLDDLDIDALLGDTPPGQPPVMPVAPPTPPYVEPSLPAAVAPIVPGTFAAPVPGGVTQAPTPGSAPAAAAALPPDAARLIAAFLEGAGIRS